MKLVEVLELFSYRWW